MEALKDMPRGSMRGVLGELYRGKDRAVRAMDRVREVAAATKGKMASGLDSRLESFMEAMCRITGRNKNELKK